jgi:hypothetical protein
MGEGVLLKVALRLIFRFGTVLEIVFGRKAKKRNSHSNRKERVYEFSFHPPPGSYRADQPACHTCHAQRLRTRSGHLLGSQRAFHREGGCHGPVRSDRTVVFMRVAAALICALLCSACAAQNQERSAYWHESYSVAGLNP